MPKKRKKSATRVARSSVHRSKTKITILAGGISSEKKVSLESAKNIASYLDRDKYQVREVIVDAKGTWRSKMTPRNTDIVFNALHGSFGEDGVLQGYLETIGIPYTGSGVTASAVGMNKVLTKQICVAADIAVPHAIVVRTRMDDYSKAGLPSVVKPVHGGSSLGVKIVASRDELRRAVLDVLRQDSVLIEPVIAGREISVPVLGGKEPRALAIAEIIPQKGESFFSYNAKYKKGMAIEDVPADLPEVAKQRAARTAVMVHELIGAWSYSRVDMILTSNNECKVLEINTLPGLTEASILPKCAAASGIPMAELLDTIIQDAKKR